MITLLAVNCGPTPLATFTPLHHEHATSSFSSSASRGEACVYLFLVVGVFVRKTVHGCNEAHVRLFLGTGTRYLCVERFSRLHASYSVFFFFFFCERNGTAAARRIRAVTCT